MERKMQEYEDETSGEEDITVPIIEMQCDDSNEQVNLSNCAENIFKENCITEDTLNSFINGSDDGTL